MNQFRRASPEMKVKGMAVEWKTKEGAKIGARAVVVLVLSLLACLTCPPFPSCPAYPAYPPLLAGPPPVQASPPPVPPEISLPPLSELTPHDPIYIEGDADFAGQAAAEGWPGNGTEENPYIIEGYEIDASGGGGSCIDVRNTRLHFTIRGCLLQGANSSYMGGVFLWNVSHATLTDNTCTGNFVGLHLFQNCSHITIMGNTCTENGDGIHIGESSHITVEANTCNNNSGGIYIYNSRNLVVEANTCNNNTYTGIGATGSADLVVVRNVCSFNKSPEHGVGIELTGGSGGCLVANNTCTHNGVGLYLDYGGARRSNITWNVLAENVWRDAQAPEVGGASLHHNYYSDYAGPDADQDGVGDTPHKIYGDPQAVDPAPLMLPPGHPPVWLQQLEDQILVQGEFLRYDLNATAPPPGLDGTSWWVSDTTRFRIDSYGVLSTPTPLPAGSYPLTVTVRDRRGNQLSATFTVTVILPPVIPGFPPLAITLALVAGLTLGLWRRKVKNQQGR